MWLAGGAGRTLWILREDGEGSELAGLEEKLRFLVSSVGAWHTLVESTWGP